MIQPTNSATMNAGAPVQKAYSAKSGDMHKWAMGSGADYWMYSQFANLMLVFSSDFHLDKRLIGIALCCPRILDGLIDPLVGHLSDITHTRWGRRRPFLLVTAILGAFLAVAIWFPSTSWPQWALFTWLTIGATLLFSVWGTYAMAHAAMGYELSDDFNDRSRVVAIRNVYFSIMAVGGGWYFWGAIQLGKGFRWPIHLAGWEWTLNMPAVGELNGVRYLSFAAGVLILVCAAIPVFFCRERFVNANRKHVSLGKACLATFKCRPFVLLLAMQIIRGLGGVAGSMGVFIGIYYVCAGDRGLYMGASAGLSSFFGVTMSFLLWPLARPLTKLIGKRVGLIWSACVSLVFLPS